MWARGISQPRHPPLLMADRRTHPKSVGLQACDEVVPSAFHGQEKGTGDPSRVQDQKPTGSLWLGGPALLPLDPAVAQCPRF